jgi:hypothetical protein
MDLLANFLDGTCLDGNFLDGNFLDGNFLDGVIFLSSVEELEDI